jgi:hypothetical protein
VNHPLKAIGCASSLFALSFSLLNAQPNLAPVRPAGWSAALVVSRAGGTSIDSTNLSAIDLLFLDWAITNHSPDAVVVQFMTALYVDGTFRQAWSQAAPFPGHTGTRVSDYLLGTLGAGPHTLTLVVDDLGAVVETDESDNAYRKEISISGVASLRTVPQQMNINCRSAPFAPAALEPAAPFQAAGGASAAEMLESGPWPARSVSSKPPHSVVDARFEPDRVHVKFRDGLNIRLRGGWLTDFGQGSLERAAPVLNTLADARWTRVDPLEEQWMERAREIAQAYWRASLPDPNLDFFLQLPEGRDITLVLDALNALDIVEIAQPVPRPVPPPLPANFQAGQAYLNAAPTGMDALASWTRYGARGQDVRIVDVEYVFQTNHADLRPVTIVGLPPEFPASLPEANKDHGTAALGVVGAVSNGWGTTGLSLESPLYFVGAYNNLTYNLAGAISTAMTAARAGDVMLIEQQISGPNARTNNDDIGWVPSEWFKPVYDRIRLAAGQRIIVVEAGGNGGENLDAPIYSSANGGHWPFLPQNGSGAIIVGAGGAPAILDGSVTARSRLSFSSYGKAVDVQGWGERVLTLGYGDAYSLEGALYYYTWFGGTSGASAMIAGACSLLQSAFKTSTGIPLTPGEVELLFTTTGTPQTSGISHPSSQHIGPLPNLNAAILQSFSTQRSFVIYNDGQSPLEVTSLALDQPVSYLHWTPAAPFTVAPGASQTVTLSAEANRVPIGRTSRRLLIASNDPVKSVYQFSILLHKNERPVLSVRRVDTSVLLSWTTNAVNFTLESATNLGPGTIWAPVPTGPVVVGDQNTLTTNSFDYRYFRLRGR